MVDAVSGSREPSRSVSALTGFDPGEWFANRGGFWGTLNQLCLCAKCGKSEAKRPDEVVHYAGILTPHVHKICDECFDALPSEELTPLVDQSAECRNAKQPGPKGESDGARKGKRQTSHD